MGPSEGRASLVPPAADAGRAGVEAPRPDTTPDSPLRGALTRAAAAASSRWERARTAALAAPDVARQLEAIAERALARAERRPEPGVPLVPGDASALPLARLAEALRRALVAELARERPAAVPPEALPLLAALDDIGAELERDASQRFINRLSGADALELLVEVAHDMRSPLSAILFLVDTLRRSLGGSIPPAHERQLSLVYGAALGLSSMTNDVIELARGGERLLDAAPAPFSVAEVMRAVHDMVLPMAEERGLTVTTMPPAGDVRLGHAAALQRVLLNLATNAIKFTPRGSVTILARPVTRTRVEFSVRDTGCGIAPEVAASLFDAFRPRPSSGEFGFSSAGLGLSICRKLVGAMGASLELETAVGEGTRFHFELDLPAAARISGPTLGQ